jgi:hypothetical protein
MTDKQMNKTEGQHTTAVLRNGGCSASYDSFVVVLSAVLRLNFCPKNPPLRKAANRYSYEFCSQQSSLRQFAGKT